MAIEPSRRQGHRWILAIVFVAVPSPFAALPVAWRVYRRYIPSGTEFYPYFHWLDPIVDGPRLVSPDGRRVVQVEFNDAGAAHSGNHWTWLIVDHWSTGKRVIAEGYSRSEVEHGRVAFPSRWLDGRSLSVTFVSGRYDDHEKNVVVRVP
jgi:hypothetical protein